MTRARATLILIAGLLLLVAACVLAMDMLRTGEGAPYWVVYIAASVTAHALVASLAGVVGLVLIVLGIEKLRK